MRRTQEKEATLYRGLIQNAWQIAWRRRELWLLGLLSALLMMNGGAFEFIVRACAKIASGAPYDGAIAYGRSIAAAIVAGDTMTQASLFLALFLGAVIFATLMIGATAAGGALLKATTRTGLKKSISARQAFAFGLNKTGPLLITQIVGRFVIFTTFVLAALGAYTTIGNGWGELVAVILFIIFATTALIVSFLMMMTDCGVMINGQGWIHACHDAGKFLKRHWLISLEMIGLVFLAAVAVAIAAVAGAMVLLIPFTIAFFAAASLHAISAMSAIAIVYEIIILAAVFVIGSMLAVFERAVWGLLYVRLADRGAIPKLERLWRLAHSKIHGRPANR